MPSRLFDEHLLRPVIDLGGQWDFVTEPDVGERDAAGLPVDYPDRIQVPGCWESHPRYRTYRGKAYLRMPLMLPETAPIRLVFKGVSHTGRVFLDGEELGSHYGAYTAFEVTRREVEEGLHELVVEVDNSFGEHSALHVENDYYTYGGITRPVSAESVPPQYIRLIHVDPRMADDSGRNWTARIRAEVRNLAAEDARVRVQVLALDQIVDLGEATVERDGQAWLEAEATFKDIDAWSPASPELYPVHALLSVEGEEEPIDDLIERIGFRQVQVRGEEVLLNGSPIKLRGLNRHEDHPHWGCALPIEAMVYDMEILQHLGANCDRTCHYPNDERWLDLCDERGILVWEENHARGLTGERFLKPLVREQALQCTEEMIEQHFNHPSIVLWGIFNECESFSEAGKALYAEQFELIKRLDTSRPTTFASCHQFKDISLDLPDVVGFNIYTGWYRDPISAMREKIDAVIEWIDGAGGGGKPLIISEFGGGAIFGYRSDTRVKWTEERQADILDGCLATYLHHPRIMGAIIWQFSDCRVTEGWATSRPRTMNNKGVVDEYRRPKLSYATVRDHFLAAAEED